MRIDWWTLALQAINVLILVWLLGRFLFRPVMAAIAARQAAADVLLADAQKAKDEAAHHAADLKARDDGFATEAIQRRATLNAQIEAERGKLLDQARAEAEGIKAQAHSALEAERRHMRTELEREAATLAGHMAERLLARLPANAASDALFAVLLGQLRALPEEEKRKLATDTPLSVVTATPLDEATQIHCSEALANALPGPAPAFTVDPALIAGFELRGPHMRIRNSWRADLDAMLATLGENGDGRHG